MIGNIHSIETLGLVDGPGIRIVIFMQGCSLRCLFCHNPDTWQRESNFKMTPLEVVTLICKYKNYIMNNGGVTFSGGEPLFQSEFLIETLKLCKKNKIHTCIDTSGVGTNIEEVLKYTDLVIFDIKDVNDKYQYLTGKKIDKSLEFLRICQKLNKKMWIRQVIIPGINDNEKYILELKKFISYLKNVEKVELLPYHTKGVSKYKKINIRYQLDGIHDMDVDKCKEFERLL